MRKTSTVILIAVVCVIQGCILFPKSRRSNPQTSDRPTIIETTHEISRLTDNKISQDSSRVEFMIYDNIVKVPMRHYRIEIVGMEPVHTSDSGNYTMVIAKGVYKVKIGFEEVYNIDSVKILGGSVTKLYVSVGGSVWD